MGRLTIEEVDSLKESGVLDNKAVEELQTKGLVGTRKRGTKYYLKNGSGKVYPQLFFKGLGKKTKPSNKMVDFRVKFNKLLSEHGTKE